MRISAGQHYLVVMSGVCVRVCVCMSVCIYMYACVYADDTHACVMCAGAWLCYISLYHYLVTA